MPLTIVQYMDPEFYDQLQAQRKRSTVQPQASEGDKPLDNPKESLTAQNETAVTVVSEPLTTSEPSHRLLSIEQFSFFPRGDRSGKTTHFGTIADFHRHLRENAAWKLKIEHIRSLTGEAQRTAKTRLPAITPSILIKDGRRQQSANDTIVSEPLTNVFIHTNLIQADFDELVRGTLTTADDFDKLFEKLKHDPHARLIFRSPRGKVKALIKVYPVATIEEHTAAFEAVNEHCKAQGFGEIDTQPKNINCLCFISHDPGAFLKDAEPLPWVPPDNRPKPTTTPPTVGNRLTSVNQQEIKDALDAIPADEYQEHWIEIGCALHHSDIPPTEAFALWDAWSQKSSKYDQTHDQMRYKWRSFQTERENKHNLGYIYHLAKQHGWQPPRREYRDDSPALKMVQSRKRRERYGYDRF